MSVAGKKPSRPDKLVFIGTYAFKDYYQKVFSSGLYQQMAANRVEGYYINELSKVFDQPIDVLSSLVTIAFPQAETVLVRRNVSNSPKAKVVNVGFLNLKYLNLFSQTRSLVIEARRWADRNRDKSVLVVVYAMRLPFLAAAKQIKKAIPSAEVINIVPDIPIYMHFNQSALRRLLSKMNQSVLLRQQDCVDGFVLYAEKMREALHVGDRPWTVIEGIFETAENAKSDNTFSNADKGRSSIRTVVYAGGLEKEYGLDVLINGFILADLPETQLHIYGSGSYIPEIIGASEKVHSIKYGGFVDASAAYEVMSNADLLVNPRPSGNEFTKYSCPSKTLEYMSTGVPVLMTRLEGIPTEYFNYAYSIQQETAEGIADSLKEVFKHTDEERRLLGQSAREYILRQKSAKRQVERLLELSAEILKRRRA